MKIIVHQPFVDHQQVFEGAPEQVRRDLIAAYRPFLGEFVDASSSLRAVLARMDMMQMFIVDVQPEPVKKHERNLDPEDLDPNSEIVRDMHGFQPQLEAAFEAARFLVGGGEVALDTIRRVLWDADGDVVRAALLSYGMKDTEENRTALKAVQDLAGLAKSETPPLPPETHVEAALGAGQEAAEAVQRAVAAGKVMSVQLGGKHSKGSLVARDPETGRHYLLKPGS